jgi:hypothetical protein
MMSDLHDEAIARPVPRSLLELAREQTSGDVDAASRVATRSRLLEAYARDAAGGRRWLSVGPILAGAAAVLLVALGASLASRHEPIGKDDVVISTPSVGLAPSPSAEPAPAPPVATPIPGTQEVLAALRPKFRRCYQAGLAAEPDMSGKLVIVATVGPTGEVLEAGVASSEGLSRGVTECLVDLVRNARFTGTGTSSTLHVPISFVLHSK